MIDPESGDAQLAEVDALAVSGAQGSSIFNAAAGARTCFLEMRRGSRVIANPWIVVSATATLTSSPRRLHPVEDAEINGAQSEREPAAPDQSAPDTTDKPAFLSASLPGFSAQIAAHADRFDAPRPALCAPRPRRDR